MIGEEHTSHDTERAEEVLASFIKIYEDVLGGSDVSIRRNINNKSISVYCENNVIMDKVMDALSDHILYDNEGEKVFVFNGYEILIFNKPFRATDFIPFPKS